jgi:hypothetical protein
LSCTTDVLRAVQISVPVLEDGDSHHSHNDWLPRSGDPGDGARWQAMTLACTDAPDSDDSDGPRRVALLPTAVLHNRLGGTELVLGAAYDAQMEPLALCRAAAGCSAMFDWYVLGSGSQSCGSQSDEVHYLLHAGDGGKGVWMEKPPTADLPFPSTSLSAG